MMTKNSTLKNIILALSILANLLFGGWLLFFDEEVEEVETAECRLYPESECAADFPASLRDRVPLFHAYSIRGDQTVFLDFSLKGTISESIQAKYDREVSTDIVRNIQMLVYFFLDYQVRLGKNDRIALFYRPEDNRITYLRLRSRAYNAVFEAFLYEKDGVETYVTIDGSILPPCLKNGPFVDCPDVRLEKKQEVLVPIFLLPQNGEVRFPFDAWVLKITDFSKTGGSVQVTFPDQGLVGFFEYLGTVSPQIKEGRRYRKGTVVGTGGFAKRGEMDGVRYYLERRDGTSVSPFFFHHTYLRLIPSEEKTNFTITQNFYRNWHKQGQEFEKQYY
ncbi:MAG TPA: hypothetical protein PLV42_06575 [bacterium]|nr:hypothetical protein [bacterium]